MDNPPPYAAAVASAPYPTDPGAAPYPTGPSAAPYPTGPSAAPYPTGPNPAYPAGPTAPYPPRHSTAPSYGHHQQNQSLSPTDHGERPFAASGFTEKSVRHAFIRKVYLILTAQLIVTGGFIAVFLLVHSVRIWVRQNSWFYYVSYATFFITYITLVCCSGVRRRFPGNFIALAIFTLAFSYMAATITSYYNTESVLICVGITGALCLAISIFAIQTRIDFTKCTALIFVLSVVLILTGVAAMIVSFTVGYSRIMQVVYGGIASLVFGLYLAFDTQMIIGGRRLELDPEEYIYGALQLYLDVVNLFLIMLSLFGSSD